MRASFCPGAGSSDRSAGISVISTINTHRMPTPEKKPNTRIEMMSKTMSDRKPQTATSPASSITGPIFTIESTTACRLAARAACLSSRVPGLRRLYSS